MAADDAQPEPDPHDANRRADPLRPWRATEGMDREIPRANLKALERVIEYEEARLIVDRFTGANWTRAATGEAESRLRTLYVWRAAFRSVLGLQGVTRTPTEERNAFAFSLRIQGKTRPQIRAALAGGDWPPLETNEGVTYAVKQHMDAGGIEFVPRKPGRRPRNKN